MSKCIRSATRRRASTPRKFHQVARHFRYNSAGLQLCSCSSENKNFQSAVPGLRRDSRWNSCLPLSSAQLKANVSPVFGISVEQNDRLKQFTYKTCKSRLSSHASLSIQSRPSLVFAFRRFRRAGALTNAPANLPRGAQEGCHLVLCSCTCLLKRL